MKTHIEYLDIFFWKYNSPYLIEMGTYVRIDLLWAGGSVAPAQPTSLRWNWGIFDQTCSTCIEGPYRKDSSGTQSCRAIDWAWEPWIPSPCSLKAITHARGSKIGSSRSRWNRGTEYYPVWMKTHIEYCWRSLERQFTYRKCTDRGSFSLRVLPQGLSIRGSEANRLGFTI